jgi:hypothetical protein
MRVAGPGTRIGAYEIVSLRVAGLRTLLELKRLNIPLDPDVIFFVESGEEGSSGPRGSGACQCG